MIKHNVYEKGRVQSLGFKDCEQDCTVGVLEPGLYDFGQAKRQEAIRVLTGYITINGKSVIAGEMIVVVPGEKIVILATATASYLCRYDWLVAPTRKPTGSPSQPRAPTLAQHHF